MREKWGTPVPEGCGDGNELSLFELNDPKRNMRKAQKAIVKDYYPKLKMVYLIPGWENRIVFVWKIIFPSPGNMVTRYHPSGLVSLCLCYILHPVVRIRRLTVCLL